MKHFGLDERRIRSFDGTEIAYWISRPADNEVSPVTLVLNNGIGVTRAVWQDLFAAFVDSHIIVFWDYRCTFRSERPENLEGLSIEDSARDVACIVEEEKLENIIYFGWSMGVQVSLEAWRFTRARLAGMFLVCGTGGKTFDTALGLPGLTYWVPPLTRYLTARHGDKVNHYLSKLFRMELVHVLTAVGIVGETVDTDMLGQLLDSYATHDFETYFALLNALGEHEPNHLPTIDIPVVVMVGDRDLLTPPITGKRIRDQIPNARLVRHEEATHFLMLEYPSFVRERLETFLDEVETGVASPFSHSGGGRVEEVAQAIDAGSVGSEAGIARTSDEKGTKYGFAKPLNSFQENRDSNSSDRPMRSLGLRPFRRARKAASIARQMVKRIGLRHSGREAES